MTTVPRPLVSRSEVLSCVATTGLLFEVSWLGGCVGMGAGSGDGWFVADDFHGALGAIYDQFVAGRDGRRGIARTGYSRQIVFAAHDRRVAHHPANIGDGGFDLAEDRSPARGGNRGYQDLTGLDLGQLIGVHDHARGAFDLARRGGHALELASIAVVAGQPLVDLFGGNAPQHAGKRFGDRLRWRI